VNNKIWSILFGVTMIGCALGFVIAPFMGWWMPEGVSTHADEVDKLFNIILGITAFFFFLTEGILVAFMWKYCGTADHKHPVSIAKEYPGFMKPLTNLLHDQHRVELAWTFVPAVILIFISVRQVDTWANIKYESRNREKDGKKAFVQIAVSARQFEWRMRYPSSERFEKWVADQKDKAGSYDSFGKTPQLDDVYVVNELHVIKGQSVHVHLTTRDVIHSFNLPNFRVKQDALPGKLIPIWFTPTKANSKFSTEKKRWLEGVDPETGKADKDLVYDIPCAELCGWGHYRMIGRVYVHKDKDDFLDWLKAAEKVSQQRTGD
jgi:cytochrome c oxidase subunit II